MSKLITIKSISVCGWLMCTDSSLQYCCDSRLIVIITGGIQRSIRGINGVSWADTMKWKKEEKLNLKEFLKKKDSAGGRASHLSRISDLTVWMGSHLFFFRRAHTVKEITSLLGGGLIISVSFRPPIILTIHSSWQPNPRTLCSSLRDKGPLIQRIPPLSGVHFTILKLQICFALGRNEKRQGHFKSRAFSAVPPLNSYGAFRAITWEIVSSSLLSCISKSTVPRVELQDHQLMIYRAVVSHPQSLVL